MMMRCTVRKASAAAAASGRLRTQIFLQPSFSSSSFPKSLPPNLHVDLRSSFAPPKHKRAALVPIQRKLKDQQQQQAQVTAAAANPSLEEDEDDENSLDEYNDDDLKEELERLHQNLDIARNAIPLPDRLHVDIHTLLAPSQSSKVGTIWLDETVFGMSEISMDLIKRAVDYYRAKIRGRLSQVSRSGKRRKQKGTGQTDMGQSQLPHDSSGAAKADEPQNEIDCKNTNLDTEVRLAALRNMLSQKLLEGNIIVLNQVYDLPTHKTADLARLLEPWDIKKGGRGVDASSALILDHYYQIKDQDKPATNASDLPQPSDRGVPFRLSIAAKNLQYVTVGNDHAANVYSLLRHDKLVLTLAALQQLEARLSTA